MKNDGLFYEKRRVTLWKTTGCFVVNEGKVCFRGNHLYGVCVFLPHNVRRQMQVHAAKLRTSRKFRKKQRKKNRR